MANFVYFAVSWCIFEILPCSWSFPVDFSTVGTGQLHSVWLASSPVFAVVFLFLLIVVLFGCVCCRPGKGFQEFRNSNGTLATSTEFVNPRAGAELTIFPPAGASVPETLPSHVVRIDPTPLDVRHTALRPASFSSSERPLSSQDWFYEPHLNFPRGQLQYVQDYGRGWFGRIVAGEAAFICPPEPRTKVIVKILHEDATPTDQMFFLHEVKAHRDLKHPNILRLLGRCLESEPFLLLLESCPNGDLKTFLTQNLASAQALTEQGVVLRMCRDVTTGLEYMHTNKFIHTDLAARNCLVTHDLTVKIGDYGNSIELFPQDYYIAGSVALPVRWCAPETLRCTDVTIETKEVTTFANVWTLAVVLWELCEFGRLPYDELTDDQVIVKVLGEKTHSLQTPKNDCLYKQELYHLMKLCCNPPLQRPTVTQIKVILENLVSCGQSKDATVDFEQRWHSSKPNYIPKTDNTEVQQKAQTPRGARVGDSHGDVPIGAFMEDSKPLGSESPRFRLKKSESVENVSGSIERLNALSKEVEEAYQMGEAELDSWLKGVEVKNEEDETFVRNISEAIRDLDNALAMEVTSSEEASEKSSSHNSPGKELRQKVEEEQEEFGFMPSFKLGGDTSSFMMAPKSFELSSLQNTMEPPSLTFTSLIFPEVKADPIFIHSLSDAEEESLKGRIERCEFSEKVKEKSKSIADLMVLTHIDPSDDSDEGDRERNSLIWKPNRSSLTSTNFGSESDIRHAVLEEEFKEGLKRLSNEHKEHGTFDSLNMIVPDEARRFNLLKTLSHPAVETSAGETNFWKADDGSPGEVKKTEEKESTKRIQFDLGKVETEVGNSEKTSTEDKFSPESLEPLVVEGTKIKEEANLEPNIFLGKDASENDNTKVQDGAYVLANLSSHLEEKRSIVPEIFVQEIENDTPSSEEDEIVLEYCPKKLRKFVLKDEKKEEIPLQVADDLNKPVSETVVAKDTKDEVEEIAIQKEAPKEQESSIIFGSNEESSVILGPFEDHTLNHYQGLRTTFGNIDIIDNWNEHLDTAMQEQLNQTNFDSITFQSLEPKTEEENLPIINSITNLGDNVWSEEENDGKLRTPDDERSSDSGFRDKGSLSESVEDACEGKYNLEDIEAELEDAFVKGAFNKDEKKNDMNFEFEESKFYEENKNDEDLSDIEGEMEYWQPNDVEYYPEMSQFSPHGAKGWYLHPPEDKASTDEDIDDDFVKALRNELAEKLPNQCRSFEQEEEFEDFGQATINIESTTSTPLTPIFEESAENMLKSPNGTSRPRRKNVVGLMESVKNIDTETFMQYLDYMVENEGKEDESLVEDNCEIIVEEESSAPIILITQEEEPTGNFEQDIKSALGYEPFSTDTEQPNSIVFEDLEEGSKCEIVDDLKSAEDVMVVDTSTNEATLLENSKPSPHVAFVDKELGDYTPDSISPDREVSLSDDSSKGEASTDFNSSPDLLSDFFITPDKTPFQSPRTIPKITTVEEIKENNEASEIVGALMELNHTPSTNFIQDGGLLPLITAKPASATEQFLKHERIHTTELLKESSRKLEKFEMSTSFMGDDDDEDVGEQEKSDTVKDGKSDQSYTPDWETSDDENSSSSGEFIWKDGGQEAELKVRQASFDLEPEVNEGCDTADGEQTDDDGTSSDSGSVTDFVPSAWDRLATPPRSALRTLDRKQEGDKRRVWFKKEKYHCIYEYPREPSDTEDTDVAAASTHGIDFSHYADWDLQDGDLGTGLDEFQDGCLDDMDEPDSVSHPISGNPSKCDFYTLGSFDEMGNSSGLSEDGEFFVSSSRRPFQSKPLGTFFTGSQFSAFNADSLWAASPTTDNLLDFITPDSGAEDLNLTTPTISTNDGASTSAPANQNNGDDSVASLPTNKEVTTTEATHVFVKSTVGSKRPDRESLTLDLPKNHNSDLGFVLNGNKKVFDSL